MPRASPALASRSMSLSASDEYPWAAVSNVNIQSSGGTQTLTFSVLAANGMYPVETSGCTTVIWALGEGQRANAGNLRAGQPSFFAHGHVVGGIHPSPPCFHS